MELGDNTVIWINLIWNTGFLTDGALMVLSASSRIPDRASVDVGLNKNVQVLDKWQGFMTGSQGFGLTSSARYDS